MQQMSIASDVFGRLLQLMLFYPDDNFIKLDC
jgi:hypothetical protein